MAAVATKVAAGIVGAGAVSAFGVDRYIRSQYGEDSLDRLFTAYKVGIPAFVAYRTVQWRYEKFPAALNDLLASIHPSLPTAASEVGFPVRPDPLKAKEEYAELHKVWAEQTYATFLQLRGFYIKTGQMIANNIGDGAPPLWQRVFRPLLDQVPPKPWDHVQSTIESELQCTLPDIFESIDKEPLASASIGQVHRATLSRSVPLPEGISSRRVVVKVMYPEVEAQFRGDISTAKAFVRFALPEHLAPLNEVEKQFANEFDYVREAQQLGEIRENIRTARDPTTGKLKFPHFIVPAPIPKLCTKRVLVMEEVPNAEKLSDALERDMADFARMDGISVEQLKAREEMLTAQALAQGKLRHGPSAADMDKLIAARTWRNRLLSPLIALGLAQRAHVPLNHARLIDELLSVHGHEILINGAFNGDPHPGNLLLSHPSAEKYGDDNYKLALIDYGQVKRWDTKTRLQFARSILALAAVHQAEQAGAPAGHIEKLKDVVVLRGAEMGFRSEKGDKYVSYETSKLYFDRDDKIATQGMHVQEFIEYLSAKDPVKGINDDMVLAARAGLMLRGLGHALGQHRSTALAWLPYAQQVLREAGEPCTIEDTLKALEDSRMKSSGSQQGQGVLA